MMKVFFITRENRDLAGARVRCYGLANELAKSGIETEVFSFPLQLGAKCGEKEFEMSLGRKLKYNLQAFQYLKKRVSADDVIFMQRLNYHTLAPFLISWLGKRKFIFDCDDWNIREDPVYHFGFYPSSKMEYFTRKLAGYADACIAASSFLKEYLSRFNQKVYYLPTGVDTQLFCPASKNNDGRRIIFSWMGTVYHPEMGDNLRFILDVFMSLAEKHSNIFLSLAGVGRYFKEVTGQLGTLKYKERIINEGWISPERIPAYLEKIDVGLLPLVQNTRFNLAKSPTKLFEYMASGRPIVASDIPSIREILNIGNAVFVRPDDAEDLARGVKELLADKNLAEKISRQALEDVKAYTWDSRAKLILDFIK
jgi:glycosyltransferase involved in cell wall biosynthesis